MGRPPHCLMLCTSLVLVSTSTTRGASFFLTSSTSILIAFSIYLLAGREIFHKRRQLRAFSNPAHPVMVEVKNPFTAYKTTEIHITSELAPMNLPSPNLYDDYLSSEGNKGRVSTATRPAPSRSPSTTSKGYDQYSVKIHSAPLSPRLAAPQTLTRGPSTIQSRNHKAAMEANTAAWGYTKVALLFFVSLLVTWV